ncbi:MAG: hypothetical protein ACOH13_08155 [Flavobacteriales bacterium]
MAALSLEREGKRRFSAEDLVVAAWKGFPDAFGLSGHTDESGKPLYPNSNRVYVEIMGTKPIRKLGYIKKVGSKMYCLTELGRAKAIATGDVAPDHGPQKWSLAREKINAVRRLMESRTAIKARSGRGDVLSFYDACIFWGISPRSTSKDVSSRFADIEGILKEALKSLTEQGSAASRHGGVQYAVADLQTLLDLHESLQKQFQGDLEHINRRIHER